MVQRSGCLGHSPSRTSTIRISEFWFCTGTLPHAPDAAIGSGESRARLAHPGWSCRAAHVLEQYFSLPEVPKPSIISPYWVARSTERFEDAPIHIIQQFFPLDAQCNDLVDKDKHPGACDLSYMAAYDPDNFVAIHDEIFANLQAAASSR